VTVGLKNLLIVNSIVEIVAPDCFAVFAADIEGSLNVNVILKGLGDLGVFSGARSSVYHFN
jgi:hypothetical protein